MLLSCRLEEVNERRQGMIGKLRIVEKEKESLEGKKLEAEAYMAKQAECTKQRIMGNKIISHQAQVGAGTGPRCRRLVWLHKEAPRSVYSGQGSHSCNAR